MTRKLRAVVDLILLGVLYSVRSYGIILHFSYGGRWKIGEELYLLRQTLRDIHFYAALIFGAAGVTHLALNIKVLVRLLTK